MKALSLLQPWASLVVSGSKNIENRQWHLPKAMHGEPFLVHASARLTGREVKSAREALANVNMRTQGFEEMPSDWPLGGIIGIARATSCLCPSELAADAEIHHPWWFSDQHGFVLEDRQPLPFVECKGALGFWTVPDAVLSQIATVTAFREAKLDLGRLLVGKKRRCDNLIANGSRCSVLLDALDPRAACDICTKGAPQHG